MKIAFMLCLGTALLTACGPSGGQGGDADRDSMTTTGQGQVYDRGGAVTDVNAPPTNAPVISATNSPGNTSGGVSGTVPPTVN